MTVCWRGDLSLHKLASPHMTHQWLTSLLSLLLLSSISNSSAGCSRSPSFTFKGTFCNKEHASISANLKCTELVLELQAGKHKEARECLCSSLAKLGKSAADPGAVAVEEQQVL
ncbi:hypothetical protein OEZ85_004394 [Tetradesmus obliquus]|uniref:Pherophorin domain-containing protein n=1 Tax=Tetradesmus obliquus TaxID=3088 RepID=A0ABY8ULB1_TETOB|nr:hypothetical protein OEZ85_004394 [Tetradesmus obliquus]